jgi:predicted transcriptional regulator
MIAGSIINCHKKVGGVVTARDIILKKNSNTGTRILLQRTLVSKKIGTKKMYPTIFFIYLKYIIVKKSKSLSL